MVTAAMARGTERREDSATQDLDEIRRARAVIRMNFACVLIWIPINVIAAAVIPNWHPYGVAAAGAGMAIAWSVALRQIAYGRMAQGVVTYTVSGLLLLLVMGIFVPELALLFTFATFIFLAFGLSYMTGRPAIYTVALTLAVALVLLVTSLGLRWSSGVPDDVFRWVNLTGMLMALSIDATMFIMLRRTLEARSERAFASEREAALLQQQFAQQERLESLGRLAGGVAHDFNNLLGIILNYAAFVAEAVADRPEVEADVAQVRSAAQRAAGLTRQLLIFGRRKLARDEAVDVNQVVTDTAELLRAAVGEQIELRIELQPDLPDVHTDPSRIEQVLLNLSVNARDAMADGGLLIIETGRRRFSGEESATPAPKAGDYVGISVTDTGSGFSEQAREHAFEPFFTTKEPGRGTGLGLATVYGIATEAGGHVSLYSEPSVGTTIRLYLPAAAEVHGERAGAAPQAVPAGAGRTVVLVEDEPQLRAVTARMLERHGFRVEALSGGDAALELLRGDGDPALLLTDVVMPGISGLELADRAIGLRPGLPVLLMSGFPRDIWERSGLDRDLPLIDKPFESEKLLAMIESVLRMSRIAAPPVTEV
jgi:signal transduction histidine kinase/CheY-like chemotaxis protein